MVKMGSGSNVLDEISQTKARFVPNFAFVSKLIEFRGSFLCKGLGFSFGVMIWGSFVWTQSKLGTTSTVSYIYPVAMFKNITIGLIDRKHYQTRQIM